MKQIKQFLGSLLAARLAVVAAAVLLIAAVGFYPMGNIINGAATLPVAGLGDAQQTAGEALPPLEVFAAERAEFRADSLRQLNEIIADTETPSELRADAQRLKLKMIGWGEQEITIEGVLRARGFEGAVATVHENSVNVLIKESPLSQSQSAMILDLVLRETGLSGGQVKIIPLN